MTYTVDNFHSMQDWLSHCACSKSICISRCIISIYFAKKKKCFFYFTHPLLQNTHINLSILHIYSIKYSFLTQYLATINDQTKKKESSGDHQPTHQNLKTTNQNHQNPLIKIIKNHWSKPSKSIDQNPKTIKQRKKIATAIGVSSAEWDDRRWHGCGETWESNGVANHQNPLIKIPKPSNREKR